MTRSFHRTQVLALVLAFPSLAMLSGCSLVSSSGAQSSSASQSGEVVMSGDYILNEDGTLRKPHVTPSVPTMNEIAFQYNETGAEQAARHFIDLINYSWASGDTTALDEFSEERCTYCRVIGQQVHDVYNNGGWAHGLKYTVMHIEGNYPVKTDSPETADYSDCYVLAMRVQRSESDIYESLALNRLSQKDTRLYLVIHWDGSGWSVIEGKGEDADAPQSE